jgi:hypothetical protein
MRFPRWRLLVPIRTTLKLCSPTLRCAAFAEEVAYEWWQFYINYSLNGEHYVMGPYHTRRFAMSHIDEVRRQPGVSNVYLGNKSPDEQSYRQRVPITTSMDER